MFEKDIRAMNPHSRTLGAMILLGLVVLLFWGCRSGEMERKMPEFAWNRLAQKTVYFGHQSVGSNIIEGIRDLLGKNPEVRIRIVETRDPGDFVQPLFAHSSLGKNEDPKSKCDAFSKLMESGIGGRVNVAFFKFCFVDLMNESDVNQVFSYYRETLERLKTKYPQTTFVHVTIPLTTVQSGLKAVIKSLVGRQIGGYEDNIKRNEYNELLLREYAGKDPVFDLARIESTFPDGTRSVFKHKGKIYYSLVPEYTDDGGHLNPRARVVVAEQLLLEVAGL